MRCPGQDTQYWKPGAIFEVKCPQCGQTVEFFKDDTTRKCAACGHRFMNPEMDFGCASYCQFAEQCLGNLPPELLAHKEDLLKDRVAVAMKRHYKTDFRRIGHATRAARYAERIGRNEGANLAVVLAAAYLHNIQGTESAATARAILEELGAKPALIDAVCAIVGRHHPEPDDSPEFKSVHDADRIAYLEATRKDGALSTEAIETSIKEEFLTENGRKEAENVLLNTAA